MNTPPKAPEAIKRNALKLMGILLLALGASAPALAEISPEYYAKDQRSAPEHLQIKVQKVEASACPFDACDAQAQTVTAEVVRVVKSASGLKVGAVITIKYDRRVPKRGWSGPRPIRALEANEVVPAFLSKGAAETYAPAARGASFQALIALDPPAPAQP
jgi:hypothetical protein